jgi:histidyl-tRNA synthetase
MGDEAMEEGLRLAAQLREAGLSVLVSAGGRSLKAQLRQANTAGARYAAIIGDDEIKNGTIMLRNMESGEQQEIEAGELVNLVSWQSM